MKVSRFVLTKRLESGQYLVVHTLTSRSLKVSNRIGKAIVEAKRAQGRLSQLPEDLVESLKANGLLVDSQLCEVNRLKLAIRQSLANQARGYEVIVSPTLGCNLACTYCYEPRSMPASVMSEEVLRATEEWIRRRLHSSRASTMNAQIYGGEPMLAPDRVIDLIEIFMRVANDGAAELKILVTTNGTLLTEQAVKKHLSVAGDVPIRYQVTLDGPEAIHDGRRFYAEPYGRGTFATILSNLCTIDGLADIEVRINADRQNLDQVMPLLCELKECLNLGRRTQPILCFVHECGREHDASLLSEEMLACTVPEIWERALRLGIDISRTCCSGICGFYSPFYDVIGPNGELYLCEGFVGHKQFICGNIIERRMNDAYIAAKVLEPWEPCIRTDCEVVLECAGGCRAQVYHKTQNLAGTYCMRDAIRAQILEERRLAML